jgi:hypothetical protein
MRHLMTIERGTILTRVQPHLLPGGCVGTVRVNYLTLANAPDETLVVVPLVEDISRTPCHAPLETFTSDTVAECSETAFVQIRERDPASPSATLLMSFPQTLPFYQSQERIDLRARSAVTLENQVKDALASMHAEQVTLELWRNPKKYMSKLRSIGILLHPEQESVRLADVLLTCSDLFYDAFYNSYPGAVELPDSCGGMVDIKGLKEYFAYQQEIYIQVMTSAKSYGLAHATARETVLQITSKDRIGHMEYLAQQAVGQEVMAQSARVSLQFMEEATPDLLQNYFLAQMSYSWVAEICLHRIGREEPLIKEIPID